MELELDHRQMMKKIRQLIDENNTSLCIRKPLFLRSDTWGFTCLSNDPILGKDIPSNGEKSSTDHQYSGTKDYTVRITSTLADERPRDRRAYETSKANDEY